MKKIFALFAAVMLVASASAKHEIGGIVGGLDGVSYKYWFNNTMAIQADLAIGLTQAAGSGGMSGGLWDFTINPNFMYHWQLPANFKIYTGGGINFGMAGIIANPYAGYPYPYFAPAGSILDDILGDYGYGDYGYGDYGYGVNGDIPTTSVLGKFGINAVVGTAYHFAKAPVVIAVDFRPGYGMTFMRAGIQPSHFFDWKLALAVRYAF